MDDDDEIDTWTYLLERCIPDNTETGGDAIYCGLYGHHIKDGVTLLTYNIRYLMKGGL